MSSELPWIHGLPAVEQVEMHAKAHPVSGGAYYYGLWIRVRNPEWSRLPELVLLRVDPRRRVVQTDGMGLSPENARRSGARWLPCTEEGIPVCLVGVAA